MLCERTKLIWIFFLAIVWDWYLLPAFRVNVRITSHALCVIVIQLFAAIHWVKVLRLDKVTINIITSLCELPCVIKMAVFRPILHVDDFVFALGIRYCDEWDIELVNEGWHQPIEVINFVSDWYSNVVSWLNFHPHSYGLLVVVEQRVLEWQMRLNIIWFKDVISKHLRLLSIEQADLFWL